MNRNFVSGRSTAPVCSHIAAAAAWLAVGAALLPAALTGCGQANGDGGRSGSRSDAASDAASEDVELAAAQGPARKPARLRQAWTPTASLKPWRTIVLHHTATETGSVESIHAEHVQRRDAEGKPWLGIGYHFVIGNGHGMVDGEVQPTFRWNDQLTGAHAGSRDHNETGIGICLVGNFDDAPPTDAQQAAAAALVAELQSRFKIPRDRILRHGEVRPTACPGRLFEVDSLLP
ncbi:MAG: N-acetylmuramoyl-L-alanine amidase [Planctomyces sp.]|nr:N-acetylmuramoyl-L-alanine amidase [Planctomyces sp.]